MPGGNSRGRSYPARLREPRRIGIVVRYGGILRGLQRRLACLVPGCARRVGRSSGSTSLHKQRSDRQYRQVRRSFVPSSHLFSRSCRLTRSSPTAPYDVGDNRRRGGAAQFVQALLERDVERCGARVDPADENATRATPASGCAPSLPATASNSHVGMAMSIRRSTAESD